MAAAATPEASAATPIIQIRGVAKRFGSFNVVDKVDLDIPTNAFFALLGPSGCGKTTLLRMLAGFEQPSEGQIPDRRPGHEPCAAEPAAGEHGVPVLRRVPAYDRGRERRLWPEGQPHPRGRDRPAGGRSPRHGPARRLRGPQARPAVRRAAPAGGAGACVGQAAEGPAARRAALRTRQEAARGDAARAGPPAARGRHHLHRGHPRPGRGLEHGRPHRGDEQGPHHAAGGAARALRAPELPIRRRLHRGDEPVRVEVRSTGDGQARVHASTLGTFDVPFAGTSPATATLAVRPEKIRLSLDEPPAGFVKLRGAIEQLAYFGNVSHVYVRTYDGARMSCTRHNATRAADAELAPGLGCWLAFDPADSILLID